MWPNKSTSRLKAIVFEFAHVIQTEQTYTTKIKDTIIAGTKIIFRSRAYLDKFRVIPATKPRAYLDNQLICSL